MSYFTEKQSLIDNKLTSIRTLAEGLIDKHGLVGWKFNYNKDQLTAGLCFTELKLIELSALMCITNTIETVTDIILHEIAHGIAGVKAKHNTRWKKKFQEIGGTGKILFEGNAFAKHISICSKCNHQYGFSKIPVKQKACSMCDVELVDFNKNNWSVR